MKGDLQYLKAEKEAPCGDLVLLEQSNAYPRYRAQWDEIHFFK